MADVEIDPGFWRGKRVFVTGHSGFKGSWLSLILNRVGADVRGFSLGLPSDPCLFQVAGVEGRVSGEWGDVRDLRALRSAVDAFQPEVAFHLAAQPFVRRSYIDPVETYTTNVLGTANFLESLRAAKTLRAAIVVTTDKCYENQELSRGYRESDPLGGHDPYSSSKACAELVTEAFRKSFFSGARIGIASARAGNVIGGGDWGMDRVVPDLVRAFSKGEPIRLRNPDSIRPWQHVLDPLRGYVLLAERAALAPEEFSRAWNFGPNESDQRTVRELVEALIRGWKKGSWEKDAGSHPHETSVLRLDSSFAREKLGWKPRFSFDSSVASIVEWYRRQSEGEAMTEFTLSQIDSFLGARS